MAASDRFVNDWLDEISLGEKYKDKFSDHKNWPKYRNWYRGDFSDERGIDPYDVVLNLTFSYIKSMVPRVYFRNPVVSVVATKPEYAATARVVEAVDNNLVRETNIKATLKSAILDAALTGLGPIKLGYDSEFGFASGLGVTQDTGTVSQISQKDGSRIEYSVDINPGMPWAARALPDEIITPYGYRDPRSLPWICHYILRPLADVQADQKYDRKARSELKGGFSIDASSTNTFSAFKTGDAKGRFCLLKEIRDFKSGRLIVLCEEKVLLNIKDELQLDGLPWEFLVFNEDPEHFWPLSDVKMFAPQQKEINEIRSHAQRQRKMALLKFFFLKGALKPEDLEKFLSGDMNDIGAGIEVNGDSIAQAVEAFTPSTNNDLLIRELLQTANDMRDVIGFSQNQLGEFAPQHNKTATETNIVNQSANIRSDERRDVVIDVFSNIIRKWNQYIFKYWSTPRVVEIVGADGFQYWVQYTGEQLRGEYNLLVYPESGMPVTRELRQNVAKIMYDTFNQDPMIDQVGLRRMVLQQTDMIDPGWQQLLRPMPGMMPMGPGMAPMVGGIPGAPMPQPGQGGPMPNPEMNVSPTNPINAQDLMQGDLNAQIGGAPRG